MDPALFFDEIRKTLFQGRMTQAQVEGVTLICDAFEAYAPHSDPRFIAYALATAFHETAQTMQPIEEIGKGRGRLYGNPAGLNGQLYYGRGFVQLTWIANYKKATEKLRARMILKSTESLIDSPVLALRGDIAAAILVFGMMEGWFSGRRLDQFFVGTRSDWSDARSIINGHDKAALIAGYALHFYHAASVAQTKNAA